MDRRLSEEIAEAGLEPELWPGVLRRISDFHRGAAVYVGQSSLARFGEGDIWTLGVEHDGWGAVDEEMQRPEANTVLQRLLSSRLQTMSDRRAYVGDRQFDEDTLCRAHLKPNGLFHAIVGMVQKDPATATAFWVARPRAAPFATNDVRSMEAFAPHVGRAMRTHRRMSRLAGEALGFRAALERLERGVLLLEDDLRLRYANPAAERMLEGGGGGLFVVKGRLRAGRFAVQARLETAMRRLADPMAGAGEIALETGRDLRLVLAPAVGDAKSAVAPAARVIGFLDKATAASPVPDMAALRRRFGLTPAEARLSACLLEGGDGSTVALAAALGVSANTVKAHLKALHDKLGVGSRTALVRVLLRGGPRP